MDDWDGMGRIHGCKSDMTACVTRSFGLCVSAGMHGMAHWDSSTHFALAGTALQIPGSRVPLYAVLYQSVLHHSSVNMLAFETVNTLLL